MFAHAVDPSGATHRYWLEAERSAHKVGGAQKETQEEAATAAARGKATAIHIGTRAMGTRFNVQMLVQVPLKQKEPSRGMIFDECCFSAACATDEGMLEDDSDDELCMERCAAAPAARAAPKIGTSNAARVSRGSEEDVYPGLCNTAPERDPSQHATITVTMYYTVAGGVPSAAEVAAAVADLDELYKACPSDKKLVDCTEVTAELTVKDMGDVGTKLKTQPYVPPPAPAADNSGGFPL